LIKQYLPNDDKTNTKMKVQLIQGQFSAEDAVDIITQMIQVKIRYHEKKINSSSHEEDIKTREGKIKQLQKELHDVRQAITIKKEAIQLDAEIKIE
jgi:hypothetical protein